MAAIKNKLTSFLIYKIPFPFFLVMLFTFYEVLYKKTILDFFNLKNNIKSNRKLESVLGEEIGSFSVLIFALYKLSKTTIITNRQNKKKPFNVSVSSIKVNISYSMFPQDLIKDFWHYVCYVVQSPLVNIL